MSENLLELRDVSHHYSTTAGFLRSKIPLRAVDGVSLSVRKGEVLGVVGESGCGKSTLARLMLGILKPHGGEILIESTPISKLDRRTIAQQVQPVFQDPYSSLNPRKTIGQIIELPLRVHANASRVERQRAVAEVMEQVGLPPRLLSAYPNQLSGGQRQRVAIARALVVRPKLLICDEPTSALDVSVQAQILNLLVDLRDAFQLTLVLISHNLAVVEHLADKVAVMYLGRVVELAGVQALFAAPRHPYTRMLLSSVLTPDPNAGLPPVNLADTIPSPLAPPPGCPFHPRCAAAMELCRSEKPVLRADSGGAAACHLVHQSAA